MSVCKSPETPISKIGRLIESVLDKSEVIKFEELSPVIAKSPIRSRETKKEIQIEVVKVRLTSPNIDNSLVEFKVQPFVDRDKLIAETSRYGNLSNIHLTKEEAPIALFALLHFDVEDNYLERLYLNYKLIVNIIDINLLYYYHNDTELKLTEIYQCNYNKDVFPTNTIPNILPFLKVLFDKLNIYIDCAFPSIESFKCEMWRVIYYKIKPSFPHYLITPHDFGLDYSLTKYKIDTFLSDLNDDILNINIPRDKYNNEDWIFFVKRLQYLENKAPIYFKHLCSTIKIPEYTSYDLKEEVFITYHISKPHLHDIALKDVYLFNRCAWNVYNLSSKDEMAYYLGFDPRTGTPHINSIKDALLKLSELGPNKYCRMVLKNTTIKHFTDIKYNPAYYEYQDFDIVPIYETGSVYYINRSNFRVILETKKNPHTEKDLSYIILREIYHRNRIAYINNLPQCLPMQDLLNKMDQEEDPSLYSLLGIA